MAVKEVKSSMFGDDFDGGDAVPKIWDTNDKSEGVYIKK